MAQLQSVEIPAPHGRLEGLLRLPDPGAIPPQIAALVCHPHPLGGGTMHNKVVFRVAQALGDLAIPVLRFNFRGVGRSTGAHDAGRGEADDVRSALDYLAATVRHPSGSPLPLLLAGFSFGSAVGLPVGCADPRVTQLIGVGVPVSLLSVDALAACAKPKLIVQGDADEYGPYPQLLAWYERLPAPKSLAIIPGSDHFFTAYQQQLGDAVTTYMRAAPSNLPGASLP